MKIKPGALIFSRSVTSDRFQGVVLKKKIVFQNEAQILEKVVEKLMKNRKMDWHVHFVDAMGWESGLKMMADSIFDVPEAWNNQQWTL